MRKHIAVFLAIILMLCGAMPSFAMAATVRPRTVILNAPSVTIDLANGNTYSFSASIQPDEASQRIRWTTSSRKIATVSADGMLTANAVGKTYVYAYAYGTSRRARALVTVKDSRIPTGMTPSVKTLTIEPGRQADVSATVYPATADQTIIWQSSNTRVASVSQDGHITTHRTGTVYIRAFSPRRRKAYISIRVRVKYGAAPKQISITGADAEMLLGETQTLTYSITPATASSVVGFKSSNAAVATVSAAGVVTAVGRGTASITVYSARTSRVRAVFTVKVMDPSYPETVTLTTVSAAMNAGETASLTPGVIPSTATTDFTYTSSDSSIVSVDARGTVRANASGVAFVTVTAVRNPQASAVCQVTVLNTARTLIMPLRRTEISGISANLRRIADVQASANAEIDALTGAGSMTAVEASNRKAIIQRAFRMYGFVWMTPAVQNYWKAANSENGAKNFQPGTVYYGMPYMSGASMNRRYDVDKAVAEGRYTDSGNGYYLLNQGRLLNRTYVGNDCSSFVCMSLFGSGTAHAYDKTGVIATSSLFRTLSSAYELRPGDVIVRGNKHVVMFLYYANSAKTQMVIIEQGGTEAAINTISASVKNVSYYVSGGYIARRLKTFAS